MKSVLELIDDENWKSVKGWMNPKVCFVLEAWRVCHEKYKKKLVSSDAVADFSALEIGVHHGKLVLALEAITPQDCRVFALDVFEHQFLNIDRSGSGNLEILKKNVRAIANFPDRVIPVQADSFSIRGCDELPHKYGLISIDGGHTREHVFNDLSYASDTVASGGLVVLDDFCNVNWLGVMEGTIEFLNQCPRRIAPFMAGFNKLFFTTISEASYFRESMEAIVLERKFDVVLKRSSNLAGHMVRALT